MDELEALRIRDEVLQAMYWMAAEGLAESPTTAELARFLAVPADTLAPFMGSFTEKGLIEPRGSGFALTPKGFTTGKKTFADEFAELTRPTHGECADDCWCHSSPEEAAKCLDIRAGHGH